VCRRQESQPTNQQPEGWIKKWEKCGKLRNPNQTHIADAAGARTLEELKPKPFQLREDDKTMKDG